MQAVPDGPLQERSDISIRSSPVLVLMIATVEAEPARDGDHFLDIDITVSAGYCNRLEAGGCLYIAGEIPVIKLLSNAPVS